MREVAQKREEEKKKKKREKCDNTQKASINLVRGVEAV